MAHGLASAGLARLSHVSLEVADLERALEFYERVFGFQRIFERRLEGAEFESVTGVPGAVSRMVRGVVAGSAIVQLFWHGWRDPLPDKRTLISFEARDARAAHAGLVSLGIECQSDPVEFEDCLAFVLHDPDGNPIEITQWKPSAEPYRVPEPRARELRARRD